MSTSVIDLIKSRLPVSGLLSSRGDCIRFFEAIINADYTEAFRTFSVKCPARVVSVVKQLLADVTKGVLKIQPDDLKKTLSTFITNYKQFVYSEIPEVARRYSSKLITEVYSDISNSGFSYDTIDAILSMYMRTTYSGSVAATVDRLLPLVDTNDKVVEAAVKASYPFPEFAGTLSALRNFVVDSMLLGNYLLMKCSSTQDNVAADVSTLKSLLVHLRDGLLKFPANSTARDLVKYLNEVISAQGEEQFKKVLFKFLEEFDKVLHTYPYMLPAELLGACTHYITKPEKFIYCVNRNDKCFEVFESLSGSISLEDLKGAFSGSMFDLSKYPNVEKFLSDPINWINSLEWKQSNSETNSSIPSVKEINSTLLDNLKKQLKLIKYSLTVAPPSKELLKRKHFNDFIEKLDTFLSKLGKQGIRKSEDVLGAAIGSLIIILHTLSDASAEFALYGYEEPQVLVDLINELSEFLSNIKDAATRYQTCINETRGSSFYVELMKWVARTTSAVLDQVATLFKDDPTIPKSAINSLKAFARSYEQFSRKFGASSASVPTPSCDICKEIAGAKYVYVYVSDEAKSCDVIKPYSKVSVGASSAYVLLDRATADAFGVTGPTSLGELKIDSVRKLYKIVALFRKIATVLVNLEQRFPEIYISFKDREIDTIVDFIRNATVSTLQTAASSQANAKASEAVQKVAVLRADTDFSSHRSAIYSLATSAIENLLTGKDFAKLIVENQDALVSVLDMATTDRNESAYRAILRRISRNSKSCLTPDKTRIDINAIEKKPCQQLAVKLLSTISVVSGRDIQSILKLLSGEIVEKSSEVEHAGILSTAPLHINEDIGVSIYFVSKFEEKQLDLDLGIIVPASVVARDASGETREISLMYDLDRLRGATISFTGNVDLTKFSYIPAEFVRDYYQSYLRRLIRLIKAALPIDSISELLFAKLLNVSLASLTPEWNTYLKVVNGVTKLANDMSRDMFDVAKPLLDSRHLLEMNSFVPIGYFLCLKEEEYVSILSQLGVSAKDQAKLLSEFQKNNQYFEACEDFRRINVLGGVQTEGGSGHQYYLRNMTVPVLPKDAYMTLPEMKHLMNNLYEAARNFVKVFLSIGVAYGSHSSSIIGDVLPNLYDRVFKEYHSSILHKDLLRGFVRHQTMILHYVISGITEICRPSGVSWDTKSLVQEITTLFEDILKDLEVGVGRSKNIPGTAILNRAKYVLRKLKDYPNSAVSFIDELGQVAYSLALAVRRTGNYGYSLEEDIQKLRFLINLLSRENRSQQSVLSSLLSSFARVIEDTMTYVDSLRAAFRIVEGEYRNNPDPAYRDTAQDIANIVASFNKYYGALKDLLDIVKSASLQIETTSVRGVCSSLNLAYARLTNRLGFGRLSIRDELRVGGGIVGRILDEMFNLNFQPYVKLIKEDIRTMDIDKFAEVWLLAQPVGVVLDRTKLMTHIRRSIYGSLFKYALENDSYGDTLLKALP